MKPRYHLPLLLLFASVLFLTNLGGYDLWPPDEPRFAQVAREMLQSGDYLVPRINGQPYTEKPPMLFWLTALFSIPPGDVSEFTARLPLALGGIATVLLTYLLARRMFNPRVAFWSGLILITNQRIWWQARFGQIDMLLTAFVTASIYCLWRWSESKKQRWLFGLYLSMAAALLTKGPPGVVFPLLLAIVWFWRRREQREGLLLLPGTLIALGIACAWMIPARMAISVESGITAGDGIATNLFRQTIGRFFLGISHAQWPWFYLTHIPLDFAPWTLFLPWTLYWVWKHRNDNDAIRFLLCWILPAFIFFSLCIGKRSIYLLPLYPPMAMLTALSLLAFMESRHTVWRRRAALVWSGGLLIAALAPLALPYTKYHESWHPSIGLMSLLFAACAVHAFYIGLRTDCRALMRIMTAHFAIVALLCAFVLFPAVDPYKSSRGLCAPLRTLAEQKVNYDLYSVGFSREEYVYYAKHFHEPVLCDLLDIPSMRDLPDYEKARAQSKMKRAIQRAVSEVPIGDFDQVSDAEIQSLRAALDNALPPGDVHRENMVSYEAAVRLKLDQLLTQTARPDPAFVMVLEEDWRWILALEPDARALTVIGSDNVGSREVLLLANDSAATTARRLSPVLSTQG